MSQEKVEKYKEYKVNKKEILAKEKKKKKLEKFIYMLIAVVVLGGIGAGIGLSAYNGYKAKQALKPNYVREEMIINDLASINVVAETVPEVE